MENEKYELLVRALNNANKAIKQAKTPQISRNLFYNVKHAILQHLDKLELVNVTGYEYAVEQPLIMVECMGYEFHQPYDSYWSKKYPCENVEGCRMYVAPNHQLEINPDVLFDDSINYIRGFLRYHNLQNEFDDSRPWLHITRLLYPDIEIKSVNINKGRGLEFTYRGKKTAVKKNSAKHKWRSILNKLHYPTETNN